MNRTCLVENAQHKKNLHTFNSGLICVNKAAHQLLCSSLLFCFRELNRFLKISVRDPRKILRVSRNSILETWFSNLKNQNSKPEPRFLILENFRGLRIEFRVETVNLHLSSTVTCYLTCHKKIAKVQCSGTIETMLNYNPQLSVPQLLPCYLVTTKLLKSGCINGVEVFEGFFK